VCGALPVTLVHAAMVSGTTTAAIMSFADRLMAPPAPSFNYALPP